MTENFIVCGKAWFIRMKKNAKVTQAEEFRSVDEFTTVEDRFIDVYVKNKRKPIRVLLGLYRGHYSKFLLAGLCFFIKHSPVWMSPIVLANIINIAASAEEGAAEKIFWNTMFLVAFISLTLPMK